MDNDIQNNSLKAKSIPFLVLVLVLVGGILWYIFTKYESRNSVVVSPNNAPKTEIEMERERILANLALHASSTPELEAEKVRLLSSLEKRASTPTAFDEAERLRILKFLAEYASNTP